MGSKSINLGVRFLLEISAMAISVYWGWKTGQGGIRYVLAFGIPLLIAAVWGTFRIPNDPSHAIVAIPGILRLVIELAVFTFAVWAAYKTGLVTISVIMVLMIAFHYAVSYDRVLWMVKQ